VRIQLLTFGTAIEPFDNFYIPYDRIFIVNFETSQASYF